MDHTLPETHFGTFGNRDQSFCDMDFSILETISNFSRRDGHEAGRTVEVTGDSCFRKRDIFLPDTSGSRFQRGSMNFLNRQCQQNQNDAVTSGVHHARHHPAPCLVSQCTEGKPHLNSF